MDGFIFYPSFREAVQYMPAEQKAEFLDAICDYAFDGVVNENVSPWVQSVMATIRPLIDANNARRENGKKGGRPTKKPMVIENDENKKPMVIENAKTEKPNNNNNNNKNKKKDNNKDKDVQADTNVCKCIQTDTNVSCESVRDLYNEICTDLPKCSVLSEQRKKHIRARCQMLQTENDWRNLFKQVQASDFLTGRSGNWRASFDWLVQSETNCTKVIEGNYTNTQKQTNGIADYSRMKISENKYTMF